MRRSLLQKSVCLALTVLSPFAFAQTTGVAVLSGTGSVYLNGGLLSNSNAVVSGDVIQTKDNGTAAINGPGGSVAIDSEVGAGTAISLTFPLAPTTL